MKIEELEKKTKAELIKIAAEQGIELDPKTRKSDVLKAIAGRHPEGGSAIEKQEAEQLKSAAEQAQLTADETLKKAAEKMQRAEELEAAAIEDRHKLEAEKAKVAAERAAIEKAKAAEAAAVEATAKANAKLAELQIEESAQRRELLKDLPKIAESLEELAQIAAKHIPKGKRPASERVASLRDYLGFALKQVAEIKKEFSRKS